MSVVPRIKPYSPAAIAALETKSLPATGVLSGMLPHEQRVVVTFVKLSNHRRSAAPRPKKVRNP